MKKLFGILGITVLLMTGIIIQSCSVEDKNLAEFPSLTTEQKELINEFELVGISHNEIMEATYLNLFESIQKPVLDLDKMQGMTLKSSQSAIKSVLNVKTKSNSENLFIDSLSIASFAIIFDDKSLKTKSNIHSNREVVDELLEDHSIDLKRHMESLFKITRGKAYTIDEFERAVNSLIVNAFKDLSGNEMEIFLCAASTAKHSFNYWSDNIHKWKNLFLKQDPNKHIIKTRSESPYDSNLFDRIIEVDVGGAVSGAIVGSITGPGIIVGAIAGSAGASSGQAVMNIWNEWGDEFKSLFTIDYWKNWWDSL